MKKKKAQVTTIVIFCLVLLFTVYYSFAYDMNDTNNRYIILAGLIVEIVLAALLFVLGKKAHKAAVEAYVPVRNVILTPATEVVMVRNGAHVYPKEFDNVKIDENAIVNVNDEVHANTLPGTRNEVALIHIDTVEENKVLIKLYKEPVSMLNVLSVINK